MSAQAMDSNIISPPYPAPQLDLDLRQIRLTTILPGRYVDTITCHLSTASVDSLPTYYSLSYVWGDRTDLRQILLNGVPFNITRNLEAALRRLRHPTESRLFWIDMLCINQNCTEERTHQVNLMQLLYSKAHEVFLWLGDYTESTLQESDPSLSSKEGQEYFTQMEAVRAWVYIMQSSTGQHMQYSDDRDVSTRLCPEMYALDRLMKSSWWHRIWTVQEVILPPKVTVVVGWLQIPWSTLVAAAGNFGEDARLDCCMPPLGTENILSNFQSLVLDIHDYRVRYHQMEHIELLDLLHAFRERLSSDPRDKIFGLLGLIQRDPRYPALHADYSLSTETVYQEIFISFLKDTGNLNLLVRQTEVERTLDLPTWIPDWTAKVSNRTADIHSIVRESLYLYKASRSTHSDIRWSSIAKTLGMKGLLFDEIATLPIPCPDESLPNPLEQFEQLETVFEMMKRRSRSYIGGEDLARAFWRLVTMDQISGQRATIEDYRKYPSTFRTLPASSYKSIISFYVFAFRFFTTRLGYIGLGPNNMKVGGTIHVFIGASVPFVLRRTAQQTATSRSQTTYEFIGNCYVQGIMDGEVLDGVDIDELGWFDLV